VLVKAFSPFGPIASVKVMWPRTEEQKSKQRNSGFVSFMYRRDAEEALIHLQGSVLVPGTPPIKIGWGKAVSLPAKPLDLELILGPAAPVHTVPGTNWGASPHDDDSLLSSTSSSSGGGAVMGTSVASSLGANPSPTALAELLGPSNVSSSPAPSSTPATESADTYAIPSSAVRYEIEWPKDYEVV
jgi:RNA recognition motif-containing protein